MTVPSKSPITLAFGATTSPYSPTSPHNGTDFSYEPNNIIYAPFAGVVTQIPFNGNDGNGSYMTEPNGRFHGMLHASSYLVSNRTAVVEGQPIAIMGETGYAFGVHLHWCVKENNVFIDPMSLIEEIYVEPVFKDTNDVRVNGYELFGIEVAGDDPALQRAVGTSKLDFYIGLGPQVDNTINNPQTGYKAQIAQLEEQAKPGTVLAPGSYQVN